MSSFARVIAARDLGGTTRDVWAHQISAAKASSQWQIGNNEKGRESQLTPRRTAYQ
jgi:hypothetical protein